MSKPSPAFRAYTVRKANQEGKKDAWIAIGAAWLHRDQKGIDIVLDAMPLDGHIVLRANEQAPAQDRQEHTPQHRKPYAKTSRQSERRPPPYQR